MARDGGATSKGMIRRTGGTGWVVWVDGTWSSRGRAGAAAEIAWEEAGGRAVDGLELQK